MTLAIARLQHL
jgi:hypothetical protein